jgi:hypothetical protein
MRDRRESGDEDCRKEPITGGRFCCRATHAVNARCDVLKIVIAGRAYCVVLYVGSPDSFGGCCPSFPRLVFPLPMVDQTPGQVPPLTCFVFLSGQPLQKDRFRIAALAA